MSDPTARAPGARPRPAPHGTDGGSVAGRGRDAGRHRASGGPLAGRLRAGLLWPLAALGVVALVAVRTLRGARLPGDGELGAAAAALLRGESAPAPVSPEGLGAAHTAVYATVTRAFQRHGTLAGAERELLTVLLLLGAVLLWRTARRLDVPDAGCAVAVLLLGGAGLLVPLHAAATPAAFAVCWLLLAGWLATWVLAGGRPPPVVAVLAVAAAVLAVLLAPDVLLLLAAAAVAAVALRPGPAARRASVVAAGVLLLAGTRLLVQRWDPQPDDPARWGGGATDLLVLTTALLAAAAVAAWRLPRYRAPAAALAVTTLLAVAPPSGRLPALLLCLPLGALLVGALVGALVPAPAGRTAAVGRRPRALVAAGVTAALLLTGLGAATAAGPDDGGDVSADIVALAGWAREQLPGTGALLASPVLTAELVHAGADPARLRTAATGPPSPVLQVTDGPPPDGAAVVARFGALTVVDPSPVQPTAEQEAARRELAGALQAAPTIDLPAADADVLAAGRVDPRLLVLLAGVTARMGAGLRGLPAVAGEPAGALVRQAVVTPAGRAADAAGDAAATEELRSFLTAQQGPYRPDRVTEVEGGLLVGYDLVPDPDELVGLPGGR
ncbi:hypothetical protein [Modestobacter versicolor]|uniref:hypothetical protein n=1 Tax=Modestobacter versicolor TaxID=429133 RepID=UPI0034E0289D